MLIALGIIAIIGFALMLWSYTGILLQSLSEDSKDRYARLGFSSYFIVCCMSGIVLVFRQLGW